jgi:hypothetical protein
MRPTNGYTTLAMPKKSASPRGNILHVRLSPEERRRVDARADREYIKPSTWARQVILRALEDDPPRGASAPLAPVAPSGERTAGTLGNAARGTA